MYSFFTATTLLKKQFIIGAPKFLFWNFFFENLWGLQNKTEWKWSYHVWKFAKCFYLVICIVLLILLLFRL